MGGLPSVIRLGATNHSHASSGDAKIGSPLLKGATVAAEVIGPEKGEKLVIQKMRRRKNFRKKTGERHIFTRVKIGKISV